MISKCDKNSSPSFWINVEPGVLVMLLVFMLAWSLCSIINSRYPFCNTTLSVEARVDNLISLINDDEITLFMKAREGGGGSPGPANNISRIGLPEYDWGVNCIHGVQVREAKTIVVFDSRLRYIQD